MVKCREDVNSCRAGHKSIWSGAVRWITVVQWQFVLYSEKCQDSSTFSPNCSHKNLINFLSSLLFLRYNHPLTTLLPHVKFLHYHRSIWPPLGRAKVPPYNTYQGLIMMTVLRSSSAAVIPTPARKFWEFDVVKNMLTTHDNRETMQNYLSRKFTFITIYLFTDLTINKDKMVRGHFYNFCS